MQIAFMLCISYGPATSTRIFASLYAAQTVKPRLGWPGQLPRLCQGICGHRVFSREFYVLPIRTWIMFLCISRQQLVLLQYCNVPTRSVVPIVGCGCGCGYLPDFNESIAAHAVLHSTALDVLYTRLDVLFTRLLRTLWTFIGDGYFSLRHIVTLAAEKVQS